MRYLLLAFGAFVVTAGIGTWPAQAQSYPWCAIYGGGGGGAQNCGFVTFQQCQATVSGTGGFCEQNSQYGVRGRYGAQYGGYGGTYGGYGGPYGGYSRW